MMGIVMPETCWAYKKHNKTTSDVYLGFYSSVRNLLLSYSYLWTNPVPWKRDTVFGARRYGRVDYTFGYIKNIFQGLLSDYIVCNIITCIIM